MASGKDAHRDAVGQHDHASKLHEKAAAAHRAAADANRKARHNKAADLDDEAAKAHLAVAGANTKAADKHQAATRGGAARPANRDKAISASSKAISLAKLAQVASQIAVNADTTKLPDNATPEQIATHAAQVSHGQVAAEKSNRAVEATIDAAETGDAAGAVGDDDGGLINAAVESLGLTGVTKTMLDHNRYLSFALFAAAFLFVFFYGTEPRTDNPLYQQHGYVHKNSAAPAPSDSLAKALAMDEDLQPIDPADYFTLRRVTASELSAELKSFIDAGQARLKALQEDVQLKTIQYDKAMESIAAQKAALGTAVQAVSALAPASGPLAPLVATATGLVLAGLGADNVRKSTVAAKDPATEQATQ